MTDDETAFPPTHIALPQRMSDPFLFVRVEPARRHRPPHVTISISAGPTAAAGEVHAGFHLSADKAAELATALLAAAKAAGWVEPA